MNSEMAHSQFVHSAASRPKHSLHFTPCLQSVVCSLRLTLTDLELSTALVARQRTANGTNGPEVRVTSGQKPCTKIVNIVLQTTVRLF